MVLEAQLGAMRDIDYGIFPYTSSSTTIAAYGPIGAGIPGVQPDHVVGVLKAYSTCVGAGPFVAENAMPEEWKESCARPAVNMALQQAAHAGLGHLMRLQAGTA